MTKIGIDLKSNDLENEIKFQSHLEYEDINTLHHSLRRLSYN
jgi:hypothetical protein